MSDYKELIEQLRICESCQYLDKCVNSLLGEEGAAYVIEHLARERDAAFKHCTLFDGVDNRFMRKHLTGGTSPNE